VLRCVFTVGFGVGWPSDDAVPVVMLDEIHHCSPILIRSPASIPVVDHFIAHGVAVGLDP
jgi:hypothetical protein